MRRNNNIQSYFKLHFIILIWGFTAVLGALISLEAIPLVWYRLALALPFLLLWIKYKKLPMEVKPKSMMNFAFGGFIIALHWVAFFMAIKVSNVSVALVTMSTGAFFASLLEPLFFKRKVNPVEVLLGILIIGGLYLIFRVNDMYVYGMLWALLAAFLSALFSVLNGLYIIKHDGFVLSFYQLLFGLFAISVFLLFNGDFNFEFFQLSNSDWLYLLILATFCTAYAFAASINLMKHLSPYTIMLSINLEPVYGIILALIVFGEKEKMNMPFYVGTILILSIVILNSFLKIKQTKSD